MPDTYQVERREVLGKKVKKLRREGVLPANLYGRGQESIALQMPYMAARDMLNAHGRNVLVEIHIDGEERPRPVIVRHLAQNPVTRSLLHVDFYEVDLARVIQAPVPVALVGDAPAVTLVGGILVQYADQVEVEALPQNLPEQIQVSVARLAEIDDQLLLRQVSAPAGVTFLSDPDTLIASITRPRLQEEDEEVPEGEEVEGEAGEEGAEETEGGAEGEGETSEE